MSFVDLLTEACGGRARQTAKSRMMAHDYRIHCFAEKHEWDVTPAEISDALWVSLASVYGTLRRRGWSNRVRSSMATPSQLGLAGADEIAEQTELARISASGPENLMAAE